MALLGCLSLTVQNDVCAEFVLTYIYQRLKVFLWSQPPNTKLLCILYLQTCLKLNLKFTILGIMMINKCFSFIIFLWCISQMPDTSWGKNCSTLLPSSVGSCGLNFSNSCHWRFIPLRFNFWPWCVRCDIVFVDYIFFPLLLSNPVCFITNCQFLLVLVIYP